MLSPLLCVKRDMASLSIIHTSHIIVPQRELVCMCMCMVHVGVISFTADQVLKEVHAPHMEAPWHIRKSDDECRFVLYYS